MWRVMIVVMLAGGGCKKVPTEPEPTQIGSNQPAQPRPAADPRAMPGATPDQIIGRVFAQDTPSAVIAYYVRADGRLDPKLGELFMRDIYPTENRGLESERPLGAPIQWNRYTMYAGFTTWAADGTVKKRDSGYGDEQAVLVKPACSITQLWQKAITAGAPRDALAVIELLAGEKGLPQRWLFSITDRPRKVFFRLEVPDDCPPVAEVGPQ